MAKVVKRGDKYVADYRIDGVRHRLRFQKRHMAEDFIVQLMVNKMSHVANGFDTTLKSAINQYFTNISEKKLSLQVQSDEKRYFEKLYEFMCSMGIKRVDDIKLIHLEKFQQDLLKNLSPSSVNRYFGTYKHFFKKCKAWDLTSDVKSEFLKQVSSPKSQRKTWRNEEILRVLKAAPFPWVRDCYLMVALTGMRPIELCRLTWADVDFDEGQFVARSYKGTKGNSERNVPMPKLVRNLLLEIKNQRPKELIKKNGRVFLNEAMEPVTSGRLAKIMKKLTADLGIEGKSLYGFRHTLINLLKNQGTNMDIIRQVAGHSSISTTERYFHQHGTSKLVLDALEGYADFMNT